MKIDLTKTDKQILAKHSPGARARALLELAIVDVLIEAVRDSRYFFELDDQEQDEDTSTIDGLKLALFNRDDAMLNVYQVRGSFKGWIKLVFGNDGWDLISDYSANLEEFLVPVEKVAKLWGE